jgi:RNA polymerase sigma factor (sigma-70 family)
MPGTEAEILERLAKAEPVIRYYVLRLARKNIQEDAAQEVRLAIWKALSKADDPGRFPGNYIGIICRNTIINHYRARRDDCHTKNADREKLFADLRSRDTDHATRLADRLFCDLILAALRASYSKRKCDMFECYLRNGRQVDVCREFKLRKPRVSRVINEMIEAAKRIAARHESPNSHQAMVCSLS